MKKLLLKNAQVVNEGSIEAKDLYIENDIIVEIAESIDKSGEDIEIIDAKGKHLLPGIIDDHVHFREPGLTHKTNIEKGSKAAIAGGITSFIEMPNTHPPAVDRKGLEEKFEIAKNTSHANYSFYMAGTNENLEEIKQLDPKTVPGIKLFLGCSTGNMLVDDEDALNAIFKESPVLITTHCEDQETIEKNMKEYQEKYGNDIPISAHAKIRSEKACYLSTEKTVKRAQETGARLHVLHLSTGKELGLFTDKKNIEDKKITAEVCTHHLWFSKEDYEEKGTHIKWNPSIKTAQDRKQLRQGLKNNTIDIIGTDHAPHTIQEKDNKYTEAPSGGPLVQHSLPALLELMHQGVFSLELLVEKMCHNPARLFSIDKRGFIREGYKADLCLVDLNDPWTVEKANIFYPCNWSPFEGQTFKSKISHTFVNGQLVYKDFKFPKIDRKVERLIFKA